MGLLSSGPEPVDAKAPTHGVAIFGGLEGPTASLTSPASPVGAVSGLVRPVPFGASRSQATEAEGLDALSLRKDSDERPKGPAIFKAIRRVWFGMDLQKGAQRSSFTQIIAFIAVRSGCQVTALVSTRGLLVPCPVKVDEVSVSIKATHRPPLARWSSA